MKTFSVLGTIPASSQAALQAYLALKEVSLSGVSVLLGLKRNSLGYYMSDGEAPDFIVEALKILGVPEQICPKGVPKGSVKIARIVEEHALLNAGKLAAHYVQ